MERYFNFKFWGGVICIAVMILVAAVFLINCAVHDIKRKRKNRKKR